MIPPFKYHCVFLMALLALTACGQREPEATTEHGAAAASFERGPHRGSMLRDGNFALELQIFEDGVPPVFHVYLYQDGKLVVPTGAQVTVELHRLDSEVNRIAFAPQEDYLRGDTVVAEPHSFSVVVAATVGYGAGGGCTHRGRRSRHDRRGAIAARPPGSQRGAGSQRFRPIRGTDSQRAALGG
jgi:cobalt-zinc-cadmium efflux system membrane fusion protein